MAVIVALYGICSQAKTKHPNSDSTLSTKRALWEALWEVLLDVLCHAVWGDLWEALWRLAGKISGMLPGKLFERLSGRLSGTVFVTSLQEPYVREFSGREPQHTHSHTQHLFLDPTLGNDTAERAMRTDPADAQSAPTSTCDSA